MSLAMLVFINGKSSSMLSTGTKAALMRTIASKITGQSDVEVPEGTEAPTPKRKHKDPIEDALGGMLSGGGGDGMGGLLQMGLKMMGIGGGGGVKKESNGKRERRVREKAEFTEG